MERPVEPTFPEPEINRLDPRALTLEEFVERFVRPWAKDTAERWLREYGTP